MIEILLALQLDTARICARYETYTPAAAKNIKLDCSDEQFCYAAAATRYANGDRVTRNYELAEYFLCKAREEMAEAEHEGMLEHLQKMKGQQQVGPLDFCDHVTSGYGTTYCASVRHDREMPRLDARLARIRPNGKLESLRKRADAFLRAESERIGNEVRGGTGYSAIVMTFEVEAKEQLVETLEQLSTKRVAATTAAEAKKIDARLNAVYRTSLSEQLDDDEEDDLDPKIFFRDAQRAWIAYRDAVADYYAERWRGSATPEVLRREAVTHLTRQRIAQLEGSGVR